jgi:hypothetical protein
MKLMIFSAAALALTGCMNAPVTQTAANDDACLRASVRPSVGMPPITASDREVLPTKCETMGTTWSGVGTPNGGGFRTTGEGH